MTEFIEWLRTHADQKGAIGDLARFQAADPHAPATIDGLRYYVATKSGYAQYAMVRAEHAWNRLNEGSH